MKPDVSPLSLQGGFTLLETLVVIVMLAILAGLATPSLVAWQVRERVDARARALAATLAYARAEALRRGARVIVCRLDAARQCLAASNACGSGALDWSCGWGVMASRRDGGWSALRIQPPLATVSVSGPPSQIAFAPPVGQTAGSFRSFELAPRFVPEALGGPRWRRCVRIAAGGRVRLTEGACRAAAS